MVCQQLTFAYSPASYPAGGRLRLRLINDRDEIDFFISVADGPWQRVGVTLEVSGFNHNVFNGFLSLRPCLYAAGSGTAAFRRFRFGVMDD